MQAYEALSQHFSAITSLRQVDSLLDWDRSVMMPPEGITLRARQSAVLNVKIHEMLTDARIENWFAKIDVANLDAWQDANLRLMREQHREATAVSPDLVARKMAQEAQTEMIWRRARAENNFALVAPDLEKLFDLVREYADARATVLGLSPYDALMAHYVPGMTSAEVDVLFDDLAATLPAMLCRAIDSQTDVIALEGDFSVERQHRAARLLAGKLGFDLSRWGRLDVSPHPFSMGIGGDVRITARYDRKDFMSSLMAVAHEAGHGFFDRHTPDNLHDQPVGVSGNMGMAIHESQSLGVEMQMGRMRGYWEHLAPDLKKIFDGSGAGWSGENLYRHSIRVARSLIRFEADEISYPLHVILRYRLEKQLVAGTLAVRDLPDVWRAGMQELVGIVPPDDASGCMQDIHWHSGAVGYFPAYALGAVIAAQFTAALKRDIPDLDDRLSHGDLFCYTAWMRDRVQSKGCLLTPSELIMQVTGKKLSTDDFKNHIQTRYFGGAA